MEGARTVSFATLGCRLNQVDTRELQSVLESRGFRTVPFGEPADVVVVNTCAVTARAEFSDRQTIRRAARVSPRARLVVTGCWAQTSPADVARLDEVALVVGNADKHRLPDLLDGGVVERVHVSDIAAARPPAVAPLTRIRGRSRAFLKIQDGCQHRCAFCIVPFARGRSRSLEAKLVLDQARRLVEAGHPEIVLTGVDMGHYGADLVPRTTLAALLRELAELPGLRWVRLSSVLPAYFTRELLEVVARSPVVAPHFHIPLQSGSDRILRAMRRPYNVAMYREIVARLTTAIPQLGLGADVIVGFPGENDGAFDETVGLIEELPFSYLHVFPYSARQGTEAARFATVVNDRTINHRARVLRELARRKNLGFRRRMVGSVETVLVLGTRDRATGRLVGLTANYVEVRFEGPEALEGRLAHVRITGAERDRTLAELVGE
jgi:threonylcarbamoyladenosine tRNA methylthiotransferase MtaB